jgi:hypothetical protein
MLNRKPSLMRRVIGTSPDAYASALGGVETGNKNPKLAPRHAPMAGGTGSIFAAFASEITTGITMLAEAVFDANDVMVTASAIAMSVMLQLLCAPAACKNRFANALCQPGLKHQRAEREARTKKHNRTPVDLRCLNPISREFAFAKINRQR